MVVQEACTSATSTNHCKEIFLPSSTKAPLIMAAASEVVGAVTAAFEVIDRVELYVNRYKNRRSIATNNIELHARLVEEYKEALKFMEDVGKHYCMEQTSSLPVCDEVVRSNLRTMQYQLHANKEKLETTRGEVGNAGAMSCVRIVNYALQIFQKDVSDFRTFLNETVITWLKTYVPVINVPPNPLRLTLDYTTEETCEGKLKAAILEGSRSGVIGIVASGRGGVGKTCALRGLAGEPEIRERFGDGILYMSLGNESNLSDLINKISRAVEVTGGTQLARTIRGTRTVREASDKVVLWFRVHKCLFLIDDIWWVNGITSDVFEDVGRIFHDESLLA